MATSAGQSLANFERRRVELEENLNKLTKALRYWQASEAEYSEIKEAVECLPPTVNSEKMLNSAIALENELVNEQEIKDILGFNKAVPRSRLQVIEILDRRIEYTNRNVQSLQGQVTDTEDKIFDTPLVDGSSVLNGNGLRDAEILEELDDDENVISSKLSHPEDQAPASIQQILQTMPKEQQRSSALTETIPSASTNIMKSLSDQSLPGGKPGNSMNGAKNTTTTSSSDAGSPLDVPQSETTKPPGRQSLTEMTKGSFHDADRVIEVDENDDPISATDAPVSTRTFADDMALRRAMLKRNLSEVENVVAEIELDNDSSNGTESEEDDEDDDENEWGLSTTSGIDEKYRKDMIALEKRLKTRMENTMGPHPNSLSQSSEENQASTNLSDVDLAPAESGAKPAPKDKGVRFADKLDIAPSLEVDKQSESTLSTAIEEKHPVRDVVKERVTKAAAPAESGSSKSAEEKPVSRFKAARQSGHTS